MSRPAGPRSTSRQSRPRSSPRHGRGRRGAAAPRFAGLCLFVGEQNDRRVLRHQPAGPVADLRAERRIHRAGRMARRERRRSSRRSMISAPSAASAAAAAGLIRRHSHRVARRGRASGAPVRLTRFIRAKYGGVSGRSASTARTNSSRVAAWSIGFSLPLMANRRERLLADAGAAERARAVSRVHLHIVVRASGRAAAIHTADPPARASEPRRADPDDRRRRRTAGRR